MKQLLALTIVLVALTLAAVATASTTTIRLTEKQTFQRYVDVGAKGESPGDVRTFGGTVFRGGKKVGHDRIRCVVAARCDAQVWLPGGSLIAKSFVGGQRVTAKITGGTGRYARARGTVTVVGGPVTRYTVRLAR
jgi:allene oxide cyclase